MRTTSHQAREFLNKHAATFALLTFFICMGLATWGLVQAAAEVERHYEDSAAAILGGGDQALALDYLIQTTIDGAWSRLGVYGAFYVVLSLIVSASFGITAGTLADKKTPSYVLLSEEATKQKEKSEKSLRNNALKLAATFISSAAGGALGKYLFVLWAGIKLA